MSNVVMRQQVTGMRNGSPWPPPGESVEVTDEEAAALVAQGMAERSKTSSPVRRTRSSED